MQRSAVHTRRVVFVCVCECLAHLSNGGYRCRRRHSTFNCATHNTNRYTRPLALHTIADNETKRYEREKKDINDEANERTKRRTNYKWYTDWYEFHACSSINPCVCVGVALCTYRSARLCVCECGAWIERFAHQPSRVEMGKKARGKNSNVYMAQRTMALWHSFIRPYNRAHRTSTVGIHTRGTGVVFSVVYPVHVHI